VAVEAAVMPEAAMAEPSKAGGEARDRTRGK
jgi:hypothetical protein